jgi:type I restriction enzyme S subunit
MKDWASCTLGDALTLQRGYDLPERDRVLGAIPIVSSSGITGFHNIAMAKAPGVVTGRYGTLGEVFYITTDYWPLNTSLYVKNFKGNLPKYISFLLKIYLNANQNAAGAVPGVNRNHLHQIKITLPPLPTQRKIAAILSAYDDLIENNNRRIAILEKMAEELYREWFVRLRFPGHEGVKIVKGVPEGWEVRKIGDLVTFDKGVSYSGEGLTETGTPMVNLKCFSINGGFRRDGVKPYSGPVRPQHIIKAGDIVIANTDLTQAGDIIGNPAIVPEIGEHQQYYFSHHLNAARLNPALNYRYYFYHLFKSPSFKGYSKGCASGTTVLGFRQGDLEKFAFFYPGEKLIKTFDELAQSLHRQIEILNKANDLQRESRDRLLARLMSGKIDVEKLDIQFPKSMLEQGEVERAEAKV